MEHILQILTNLNIPFEMQEHKAIFSEEDSMDVEISLEGMDVKNLFVKDKNHNYVIEDFCKIAIKKMLSLCKL